MAPPTVQPLQRLAAETGYRPDTLEKVLRLLELLDEIAQDPVLSQRLALKGGTALNVFCLDLDGLSVDIDLNYVGALDLAAMERERPEVDAAIDRLFASQGYGVRRRPTGHAGGKWLARYASALGGNASLELDLNDMARQPLFGAVRMESRILGRVGTGRVLVLDLHEIVAGKIVALFDRGAARDLFDVRRILAIEGLDRGWIKAAVLALGACNWRGVSKDAIGCDSREFRRNLAICLPRDLFRDAGDVDTWIAQSVDLCIEPFVGEPDLSVKHPKVRNEVRRHGPDLCIGQGAKGQLPAPHGELPTRPPRGSREGKIPARQELHAVHIATPSATNPRSCAPSPLSTWTRVQSLDTQRRLGQPEHHPLCESTVDPLFNCSCLATRSARRSWSAMRHPQRLNKPPKPPYSKTHHDAYVTYLVSVPPQTTLLSEYRLEDTIHNIMKSLAFNRVSFSTTKSLSHFHQYSTLFLLHVPDRTLGNGDTLQCR